MCADSRIICRFEIAESSQGRCREQVREVEQSNCVDDFGSLISGSPCCWTSFPTMSTRSSQPNVWQQVAGLALRWWWFKSSDWSSEIRTKGSVRKIPWTSLIRVSSTKGAYTCVRALPPKHQMRLYVCHQMRLHVCHQMRLLSPQRSSLRSLTFARFARTFFNKLNKYSCLKRILVWTLILV